MDDYDWNIYQEMRIVCCRAFIFADSNVYNTIHLGVNPLDWVNPIILDKTNNGVMLIRSGSGLNMEFIII